jgi:hypothetical protein
MAHREFHTYTSGFKLTVHAALTKHDIVRLCRALEAQFGPEHSFRPEPISDGFIQWTRWPGCDDADYGYKCMRLHKSPMRPTQIHRRSARAMEQFVCKYKAHSEYKWPWVGTDVMEAWDNDAEHALPVGEYTTFLKAFDAAFGWTVEELLVFKRCLEEELDVQVKCVPKQSKLGFRPPRSGTR